MTPKTASRWHHAWEAAGEAGLRSAGSGSRCRLDDRDLARLEAILRRGPGPYGWDDQRWTLARIAQVIDKEFGVGYTLAGVWLLLDRHGWSCQLPARRAIERDDWSDPGDSDRRRVLRMDDADHLDVVGGWESWSVPEFALDVVADVVDNVGDVRAEGAALSGAEAAGSQVGAHAAAGLREAMLRGDFAPGQRLVEADLCEQFQASRFVIRVALQELAGEGLVEIQRNRGARVRQISLEEAVEITEARMVLEGLVAAKAAQRRTPAEVRELRGIAAAMRKAVKAGEPLTYSDLNATLHRRLREIARHPTSALLIERLHAQVVRHQFKVALQPGRPAVSLRQHESIIAAVVAGDAEAAERATREHLTSVAEALRAPSADC